MYSDNKYRLPLLLSFPFNPFANLGMAESEVQSQYIIQNNEWVYGKDLGIRAAQIPNLYKLYLLLTRRTTTTSADDLV